MASTMPLIIKATNIRKHEPCGSRESYMDVAITTFSHV